MVGSEVVPFSKTGGLADVLGALPLALARLGWEVTVVAPRYRGVTDGTRAVTLSIPMGGQIVRAGMFEATMGGASGRARAVLVDVPELYDRDELYTSGGADYPDNARRFGLLSRAALEWATTQPAVPCVVHAHDWQAGLVPVLLKTVYASHARLGGTPSVFTIHNLAYQGLFEPDWLARLGLPGELLSARGLEFWGRISFLKGGINYADAITTVSPRYAQEIQTTDLGFGMEGVLRQRANALHGILNGVDAEQWNPETDAFLPERFSVSDLGGKAVCKAAVLREYGLPADEAGRRRPLIGMISRMVDQKGLDLLAALRGELPRLGATFVILGTGDARYEEMWRSLAAAHPGLIGVRVGFDEGLAHRIEAGADMFMMPSRFEPCGLNQMYSLRYGTVPIVREVGGLADTVKDRVTGFVFREYSADAFLTALKTAIAAFAGEPAWKAIQAAGMQEDYSWDRSAREYVRIYEAVERQAKESRTPKNF